MSGDGTGIFNSAKSFWSKVQGHMGEGRRNLYTGIGAGVGAGGGMIYGGSSNDRPFTGALAGGVLGALSGGGIGYGAVRGMEAYANRAAAKTAPVAHVDPAMPPVHTMPPVHSMIN